ncbi:MAG: DNA polymerase II small subunit, partial [Candidatus Methanoperedens sp.]|nr:DNA polymerase II small subunit [Candidatus Methanoperedens sp.]
METGEIIEIFAESGFQIDPRALDAIKTISPELIHDVLKSIDSSVLVVGIEHIKPPASGITQKTRVLPGQKQETPQTHYVPPVRGVNEAPVTILKDITNQSTCIGEYTEFVQYFKDRYSSLGDMLRKRMSARPIESIKKRNLDTREPLSIIGMVLDIRTSAKGHKLIEVEDTTGTIPVLIHKEKDKELFESAKRILLDEVIGFTGTLSSDGNIMFANRIMFPDIPNSQKDMLPGKKQGG